MLLTKCVCETKKKQHAKKKSGVSSCRDSTRGCRTRSFTNDYADAEFLSLRSFLCLRSPLQNLAPRHAQTTRDVFTARGEAASRDPHTMQFLLLLSKALAALAFTAPLCSLAQGFKAFRAQEILLCWREISQTGRGFVLAGAFPLDDEITLSAGMPLELEV